MKLLIVESPTKTKTLQKFLGKSYQLASTNGHIIDLPKSKLGVDIENDFEPQFVTIKGKGKILTEIKKLGKQASDIYLAPDPDREGEAIAFHLANSLSKTKANIYRVTFNEITKKAVLEGIKNAGQINTNLVNAQQARRILDRLVGYKVSPLLWKTITYGLSAGRVQSVALRLICEREVEIEKFVSKEYWTIDADFIAGKSTTIPAKLIKLDGKKPEIDNQDLSDKICEDIKKQKYEVSAFKKGNLKRQPLPPFITSTLQQDAYGKLGFNNKKTMTIAQQLYEGVEIGDEGQVGLITYMRTDSVRIANIAQDEARKYISETYGDDFKPEKPKTYRTKKSAQDAHEAVRPTSSYRDPSTIKKFLSRDQNRLYTLIWSRFMASQMADAQFATKTAEFSGGNYVFRASEQELVFEGWLKVYSHGIESDAKKKKIPELNNGDTVKLSEIKPEQHFTQPPARFNSGSLVKELEEKGIGRPSTYAQIVTTLTARKYVELDQKRFKPTDLGKIVTKILVENFEDIFNTDFTAKMEEELDRIEDGNEDWVKVLKEFFDPFSSNLKRVEANSKDIKKQTIEETDEICDKCGSTMVIKFGRNGRFLACSAYPDCKNTRPLDNEVEKTDKICPNCGSPMEIRIGRFGRFMACSKYPECKTTQSIPSGVNCPEDGCDGEILERSSRKGKIFFSCSRYPDCKFSLWSKPVNKECPSCGNKYMVEKNTQAKGDHLYCPVCKHRLFEEETEKVKS